MLLLSHLSDPQVVDLTHPSTGKTVTGLLSNNELHLLLSPMDHSWFLGNSVALEQVQISMPVNPLFFLLNTLKISDYYVPMDDLIEFPFDLITGIELETICDVKEIYTGTLGYKFNQEKTLNWLKEKHSLLMQKFNQFSALKKVTHSLSVLSQSDQIKTMEYTAFYILSDYLSQEWKVKLAHSLSLDPFTEFKANPENFTYFESVVKDKKTKFEDTPKKKPTKLSLGQAKLAKADKSGMKKISSFFQKK